MNNDIYNTNSEELSGTDMPMPEKDAEESILKSAIGYDEDDVEAPEITDEDIFASEPVIIEEDEEFVANEADEKIKEGFHGFNVTHSIKPKEKRRWPKIVALSLLAGIVAGTSFGISNNLSTRLAMKNISLGSTGVSLTKTDKATDTTNEISEIAESFMPAIVAITSRHVSDVMTFFGKYSQESTSSGSGIIIGKNDTELLIVTNYHVVANSKELSVVFSSVESELELQNSQSDISGKGSSGDISENPDIPTAVVKGYNSDKDLAVIAVELNKIPADVLSEIKVATIGDSSATKPGEQVVAIGNALGYGQSVTVGYVSAVNRKITMESSDGTGQVVNTFIQTDAAINPGNSGGALLNMAGEVIGINSVKIATNGVEGMGYAIPISDVGNIIDELMVKETRSVVPKEKQGFLGIEGADVTSNANQVYGIPAGVFVSSVMEGLAADKAGIKKGYVITHLDGYTITSISQLQDRLTYYKSGEKVKVKVQIPTEINEYSEKEITVTLSNRSEHVTE